MDINLGLHQILDGNKPFGLKNGGENLTHFVWSNSYNPCSSKPVRNPSHLTDFHGFALFN